MNQQLISDLENIKKLISKGWARQTYAVHKDGKNCHWSNPDAVCFCLAGAINRVVYGTGDTAIAEANTSKNLRVLSIDAAIIKQFGNRNSAYRDMFVGIFKLNDYLLDSKEQVVALIEDTINSQKVLT